jgi:hypothetical protein
MAGRRSIFPSEHDGEDTNGLRRAVGSGLNGLLIIVDFRLYGIIAKWRSDLGQPIQKTPDFGSALARIGGSKQQYNCRQSLKTLCAIARGSFYADDG